jgi:hypothetical protein
MPLPFNHLIAILIPVTTRLIFTSLLFDVQPISTHVVGCDTIPTPSLSAYLSDCLYCIMYHLTLGGVSTIVSSVLARGMG